MNTNKNNWCVITGTLSTGKTTLINGLRDRGFHTEPEFARVYIDEQISQGKTIKEIRADEGAFQSKTLKMRIDAEGSLPKYELIFFDRGIPDSIAYFELINQKPDKTLKEAAAKCNYNKVFLLDMVHYKKDYARVETEEERQKIQSLLEKAYTNLGFDIIKVPVFDTKEERVDFVLNHIGK